MSFVVLDLHTSCSFQLMFGCAGAVEAEQILLQIADAMEYTVRIALAFNRAVTEVAPTLDHLHEGAAADSLSRLPAAMRPVAPASSAI